MKRINVTLDDHTLALLRRIGERVNIADRSAAIRYVVMRVAREEALVDETVDKEE